MAAARNVCLCAAWFKCEEEVNLASRIKGARGMNPTESGWCPLVSGAGSSWCLFLCPFHLSGDVVNQYNPKRQHFTEIFPRKSFFSTRPQWLRTCPPHRFLSVNSLFFFRHLLRVGRALLLCLASALTATICSAATCQRVPPPAPAVPRHLRLIVGPGMCWTTPSSSPGEYFHFYTNKSEQFEKFITAPPSLSDSRWTLWNFVKKRINLDGPLKSVQPPIGDDFEAERLVESTQKIFRTEMFEHPLQQVLMEFFFLLNGPWWNTTLERN